MSEYRKSNSGRPLFGCGPESLGMRRGQGMGTALPPPGPGGHSRGVVAVAGPRCRTCGCQRTQGPRVTGCIITSVI